MDFLVEIHTTLPPELPPDVRDQLLERESARGRELRNLGVITAIWRLPGRLANVAIWSVDHADHLDGLLKSLPLWTWMQIEVTALATHPLSTTVKRLPSD